MNWIQTKKILCIGLSIGALGAGGVFAARIYQAGNEFQPAEITRSLQANQVVFSGDRDMTGRGETNDGESELWKKEEEAEEAEAPRTGEQSGYFFENGQIALPEEIHTAVVEQPGERIPDSIPEPGIQDKFIETPNQIYDVVSDREQADLVVENNSSGTGTGENGQGNGGGYQPSPATPSPASPAPTAAPEETPKPAVSPQPTAAPTAIPTPKPSTNPADSVKDPEAEKSNPIIGGSAGQIVSLPFKEGVTPATEDEADGDNISVVIQQSSQYSGSILYAGQEVDEKLLFYSLDTYVRGNDMKQHLWNADAYNVYVRIEGISFDGGESWIRTFPVVIPQNLEAGKMRIQVGYRLSTTSEKWVTRNVSYTPMESRVFVLSEQITEENTVIAEDTILNVDQHPAVGSKLNLLRYQYEMLGYGEQTVLFPGWMENGEPVEGFYEVTGGRHVLEPRSMVELDGRYKVELRVFWMSDEYDVGFQYSNLCYLQTLVNYDQTYTMPLGGKNGSQQDIVLSIPEGVQAVEMDADASLFVDYLEIPASVLFVDDLETGWQVEKGYRVSEDNRKYAASADGILTNKAEDEIYSIPVGMENLRIPAEVKKVNAAPGNQLRNIWLEAESMEELPEISLGNLENCQIYVKEALLEQFLADKGAYLSVETGNQVAAEEAPEISYHVEKDAILTSTGELYRMLDGGNSITLPSSVKTIGERAFEGLENSTVLILPKSGRNVTFEKDSLAGSRMREILCYSQNQYDSARSQLEQTGAEEEISVKLLLLSREGYTYCVNEEEAEKRITLITVPDNIESFDGILTAVDGEKLEWNVVGENAFADCENLTEVTLPESVDTIGYRAFENCTALEWIFISTKESITIGRDALEGCSALRFVASNAAEGIFEDGYSPSVTEASSGESVFYVPTNAAGYGGNCISFTEESGVAEYQVISTGEKGKVLYGLDEQGTPWLALRSGSTLDAEVNLPVGTIEIFQYAFADTVTEEESYRVNWEELFNLFVLDGGAFRNSQVGGEILLGEYVGTYILGEQAFYGCSQITSVKASGLARLVGRDAFQNCGELVSVDLGTIGGDAGLYLGLFTGCDKLQSLKLDNTAPPELVLEVNAAFQFNYDWTPEEEAENLSILVPEGAGESYVSAWRYPVAGSFKTADSSAYLRLWYDIYYASFDWDTMDFLPEEEIDTIVEGEVLFAENIVRRMLGLEQVSEPSNYYWYRNTDGYLYFLGAGSDCEELNFYWNPLDLPDGWYVDYIQTGAFSRCSKLQDVVFADNLAGIYTDAFTGVESEKLVLEFWGDTPPELLGWSEGNPFSFGIEDERLCIQVPEYAKEAYLEAWLPAFAGSEEEEAVEAARERLCDLLGLEQEQIPEIPATETVSGNEAEPVSGGDAM